ncbi:MAG: cysteine hydrolase [Acidobacteria bacterium]|nr:cysteine hydrolase [Acidobacteriota bacterium]
MKTVFFDIDTQIDFLFPAGALYVPGAEKLLPAIARLNRYAAGHGIPVVSTTCAHAEDDPEFRHWPPHCVVGTAGQAKPAATLLERRAVIPSRPQRLDLAGAQQILLEKQELDLFTNPNLPRLLEEFGAEEYCVYGVVTEYCVRCAAMGLLDTGASVRLVSDAVRSLKPGDSERTLREFVSRGGVLTTVEEICGG